jgi:hypothetical protein
LWISEHKSREADKGMYGYLLHMQKSRIKAVNYEVLFVVVVALKKCILIVSETNCFL